jgi:glycosyltransferase involved in cell wall biosynthesis
MADLLVFPPRWEEGQGLVAIEAMSAGLPVVATASGGLSETVRDGVEGLIVPKCDPAAIADSVARLLDEPDLRARLGAAGRARFEAEYTIETWQARMSDAFRAALEEAFSSRRGATIG